MPFRTRALERATHDVGVHLVEALADLRLSQAEIHVLGFLADAGPSTVGAIHGSFGHRRSTLSSVLNRLEDRGLVVRTIRPEDRRSYVVSTTDRGAVAAARVRDAVTDLEDRVAAAASPGEMDGFAAVVEAIRTATGDRATGR